jgi:small subunit ribosomal protein S1
MSTDPSDRSEKPETTSEPTPNEADAEQQAAQKRRILIGSQRDPAAYRARPKRDWTPIDEPGQAGPSKKDRPSHDGQQQETRADAAFPPASQTPPVAAAAAPSAPAAAPPLAATPPPADAPPARPASAPTLAAAPTAPAVQVADPAVQPDIVAPAARVAQIPDSPLPPTSAQPSVTALVSELFGGEELAEAEAGLATEDVVPRRGDKKVALPNIRAALPPDLEDEFQQALGDAPMDSLLGAADEISKQALLEPESKQMGRVMAIHRDDVFIELGGREQGVVPLLQFDDPPQPGQTIEVRIRRFNAEEGLYELALPNAAASIGDWSDLSEGLLVEAKVTGHNTGGLEAEVNHIRGFIPISQVALYRVEHLEEFVGQSLPCLVVEANPDRRNLVLSHRAVLEREKEEARKLFWQTLEVGQVREGVVRKLMDFGAFIDLGGADGLLHISQLAWGRVKHPSEVLQEGQTIRVRVDKIDPESRRIGLAYRELMQSPWTDAEHKYPPLSTVRGKVTKLMDFGAFVEIEPGVEGLVHISELAHKRVWRVSDVVKEGDEVDAVVLSIDTEAKRISLSMKNALPPEEPPAAEPDKDAAEPPPPPKKQKPSAPLRGGLGRSTGDQFGLKW